MLFFSIKEILSSTFRTRTFFYLINLAMLSLIYCRCICTFIYILFHIQKVKVFFCYSTRPMSILDDKITTIIILIVHGCNVTMQCIIIVNLFRNKIYVHCLIIQGILYDMKIHGSNSSYDW